MIPSVGRIVHYVLPETIGTTSGYVPTRDTGYEPGEHLAAIITRVWDSTPHEQSCVQLTAFADAVNYRGVGAPLIFGSSVHQDAETKAPGTWHCPEIASHNE